MKNFSTEYSGILLAGGKSSRMGHDKAFIKYKKKYLYEFSLSVLKKYTDDIVVSSSDLRFESSEYRLIKDEIPGLGPLGGLYTCLKGIRKNSAIVLPCDLPHISEIVIDCLLEKSAGYDITIALNHNNLPEPLVGIYSSSILPVLTELIGSKQYKMQELFLKVNTNFVLPEGISADTFKNINTPKDLKNFM